MDFLDGFLPTGLALVILILGATTGGGFQAKWKHNRSGTLLAVVVLLYFAFAFGHRALTGEWHHEWSVMLVIGVGIYQYMENSDRQKKNIGGKKEGPDA